MRSTKGFNDDLACAIWTSPTGAEVLVCKKPYGGGFLLYQKDEWNNDTGPAFEADFAGCVLRDGQYEGYHNPAWIVPKTVRDQAISQ